MRPQPQRRGRGAHVLGGNVNVIAQGTLRRTQENLRTQKNLRTKKNLGVTTLRTQKNLGTQKKLEEPLGKPRGEKP